MADTDDLTDQEVVAKTLFGEASNQGYEGQVAVANVIQNRVSKPCWWGTSFRSVCLKREQFSCWNGPNESNPNRARLMAVQAGDTTYDQCLSIAGVAIDGSLADTTDSATSYCTLETNPPWAKGLEPTVIIGQHKFYKL